jgi:hypothetical protein
MTSGSCVRCGRIGEIEYGTDGMAYCSSCAFYGLNKQCWRCRMYLPATELQQYRGQWTCPYCIQDLREADRKASEYHEERPRMESLSIPEQCERCGRDLKGMVYIWNGRKLCKSCVSDEQQKWGTVGGGPMASPQRITVEVPERVKRTSLAESLISEFLHLLGIKRKPKKTDIVVYGNKMPIGNAKPMAEERIAPKAAKADRRPKAEGLMKVPPSPLAEVRPQLRAPPAGSGKGRKKARSPRKSKKGDEKKNQ